VQVCGVQPDPGPELAICYHFATHFRQPAGNCAPSVHGVTVLRNILHGSPLPDAHDDLRPAKNRPLDTGQQARVEVLRRDAECRILDPLRLHKWDVAVEREANDFMLISAERGEHRHRIAFIYTSATDNAIYKALAAQVEHIFFNGQPYHVEAYAYGIDKPVSSVDDFHSVLVD
jgi:hypothetical protein